MRSVYLQGVINMNSSNITANLKPGIWGVILGAAALAIVGFNWGGWVTGKNATAMADAAVIGRLVPICVQQFNDDANKAMKLAEMKKGDSWRHAEFVEKQGWATMPGAKKANSDVAEGCASAISS